MQIWKILMIRTYRLDTSGILWSLYLGWMQNALLPISPDLKLMDGYWFSNYQTIDITNTLHVHQTQCHPSS